MQNRFAFIVHYPSFAEALADRCTGSGRARIFAFLERRLPAAYFKKLLLWLPPSSWIEFNGLHSVDGNNLSGLIVMCPFIPEQIVTSGEVTILKKLVHAGRLAERRGARLVGLAAFSSIVGNEGEILSKALNIPVTSGNSYTAALAIDGIRKACHLLGKDLGSSTMAVIGATGDIGSACCRVFVDEVKELRLAARNEPRLEAFTQALRGGARVSVKRYVKDAVRDADIILTATSALTTVIEAEDVKAGTIICDVAIPHDVASDLIRRRPDVFAFEGGLARLPFSLTSVGPRWERLSPDGVTVFGCLAETMLLALENRWESFSLGRGHITPERIRQILQIASHHGFRLADFRYGGQVFNRQYIENVRRYAKTGHSQESIQSAAA